MQTIGVVICISFVLIAFLAWFIFGRDKIVVDTVEFNAPGKLNPLELSFIYEGKVKKEAIIIDLASNPGGVDRRAAREKGIKVIWALSLPAKVAPLTSAEFIKETLYHVLKEL